jgi:hypothetical protein
MNHLRESEFVDLLDHVLPAERARHVEECSACAEQIEALRSALGRVADVDVPEPSPLFWEHFSSRVREGVKDATPADSAPWSGWIHQPGLKWALAGALVAVLAVVGVWRSGRVTLSPQPETVIVSEASPVDAPDIADADDDRAWDLVRVVADEVPWNDDVDASLATRPGTVERAVLSLKGEARAELVRLLEAETKRPGA